MKQDGKEDQVKNNMFKINSQALSLVIIIINTKNGSNEGILCLDRERRKKRKRKEGWYVAYTSTIKKR